MCHATPSVYFDLVLLGLVALALLESSCPSKQCPAFVSTTMMYLLHVLFSLGKAYDANLEVGLASGQHSRSSTKFVAFVVPVQL